MASTASNLPFYYRPGFFIALATLVTAGLLWFAGGMPGLPPKDGEYSCLDNQQYKIIQMPGGTFDPRKTQFGATVIGGKVSDVRVYAPDQEYSTTQFSFGSKDGSEKFSMTIEGTAVTCYRP